MLDLSVFLFLQSQSASSECSWTCWCCGSSSGWRSFAWRAAFPEGYQFHELSRNLWNCLLNLKSMIFDRLRVPFKRDQNQCFFRTIDEIFGRSDGFLKWSSFFPKKELICFLGIFVVVVKCCCGCTFKICICRTDTSVRNGICWNSWRKAKQEGHKTSVSWRRSWRRSVLAQYN